MDIVRENVKEVKWVFVGIKEIVNLQWGISIAIDDSKSLARVIIKIFGHGGSDLFVGDIGEAEDRFERIAQRLGAVDLLAGADPLHPPELISAAEASDAMASVIRSFSGHIEGIRATASPLLDDYNNSKHEEHTLVLTAHLRAFLDALEGAEGVDDG